MQDYKPNSHRFKEEQKKSTTEDKKIQKVVQGSVKTRKKPGLTKFTDVFISEDASNVKTYILTDVLVPAVKKLVSDIVRDGIDMILYGSTGGRGSSSSGSKVSYRDYYDRRDGHRASSSESRARNRFDYDDIIYNTRGDAESVLSLMCGALEEYKIVTVADMYDMAGLTEPYTSNRYGWTNLRTAEVQRVRDGFIIKLPKAMPID